MERNQAVRIIRAKYFDEMERTSDQATIDEYKRACEQYPALMATAHYLWAMRVAEELAKERKG